MSQYHNVKTFVSCSLEKLLYAFAPCLFLCLLNLGYEMWLCSVSERSGIVTLIPSSHQPLTRILILSSTPPLPPWVLIVKTVQISANISPIICTIKEVGVWLLLIGGWITGRRSQFVGIIISKHTSHTTHHTSHTTHYTSHTTHHTPHTTHYTSWGWSSAWWSRHWGQFLFLSGSPLQQLARQIIW